MNNTPEPDIAATERKPAKGWSAADVCMLDELAQIGLGIARDMAVEVACHRALVEKGEAQPHGPDEASKVTQSFERLTKAIRLTLALKAHALGAAENPTRLIDPPREPHRFIPYRPVALVFPNHNDPEECAEFKLATARAALEHVVSGPGRSERESEVLRERLELHLGWQRGRKDFAKATPAELIDNICESMSLPVRWKPGLDRRGELQRWVIARPGDDGSPVTVPTTPLSVAEYLAQWPAPKPRGPP